MNIIKRDVQNKLVNSAQSSRFDKYDVIIYWLLCGAMVYLTVTILITTLTKTVL